MAEASTPKRSEDDCDMVTSLQEPFMSKSELALHESARIGDASKVEQLVDKMNVKVDCRNNLDRTALHMAASRGQLAAVKMLLEKKANIELTDKYGMSALMWATYFGHKEVVNYLLDKAANVKRRNKLGMHCLHIAADCGFSELVNIYLKKTKFTILNDLDKNDQTALMIAAAKGHANVVEALLGHTNVDVSAVNNKKKNALHLAAESGSPTVLELLLKVPKVKEDRLVEKADESERIPLHHAVEKGHVGAIKMLLSNGAGTVDMPDKRGNTAFHLAAMKNFHEVLRVLKESGANVAAYNTSINGALHLAVLNDDAAEIYMLVHLGCDLELPNKRNQTALHVAVEQNKPNAVEALLLCGAPLNVPDKAGKTPLVLATRGSYICLVDMIIKEQRRRERAQKQKPDETLALVDQLDGGGAVFKPADYGNCIRINDDCDDEEDDVVTIEQALSTGRIPTYRLREFNQLYAEEFKQYLWKLAFKHLRHNEWKKLAQFWNFRPEQIEAIEHQYTGENSYKQHGYRVLCIWFHGISKDDTPIRELYESLVTIDRRQLAEKVRKKLDKGAQFYAANKQAAGGRCSLQ